MEEKLEEFLTEAQDYCTKNKLVMNDLQNSLPDHAQKRQCTIPSWLNDGSFILDHDASVN